MSPRHTRSAIATCALALAIGCGGKDNPGGPSPTPEPTRIISLSGDLNFGEIDVGESAQRSFRISNTGNSALSITGLTGPSGGAFAASFTSGTVTAGGSQDVTVSFTPSEPRSYSGTMTVNGNQTSGSNTLPITAAGGGPLWRHNGTGDSVFDMPRYIQRVFVSGTYVANSSNFIVRIDGRLLVNELLGTGWNQTVYEGTLLTGGGGVVSITNSSGVIWTFAEVR